MKATCLQVLTLALLLGAGTAMAAGEPKPALTPDDIRGAKKAWHKATPQERQMMRRNAGELQKMTPEERRWALDNQDAIRDLGNMPDEEREGLLDLYRQLSPEEQKAVREAR